MKALFRCVLLAVAAMCPLAVVLAEHPDLVVNEATNPATDDELPGTAISSDSPEIEKLSCTQDLPVETPCHDSVCAAMQPCQRAWTIDYRVKSVFDSHTTYQFGMPESFANPYSPLSKLAWPLDSTWHGLQIGLERPNWRAHFEWLTPMVRETYGNTADYDWSGPDRDPASLSSSPERWNDGQMLELEGSFKLTDHIFKTPFQFWPVGGFRFQRFDFTAHDGVQVINDGSMQDPNIPPVGYHWEGDTGTFNQQYYMGYIGGQIRTNWNATDSRCITFVFQGDWAATWGYNVDHHISGYEDRGVHRYTMENTQGGAFHLALIAEMPLSKRFFFGIQADHTEIRTTGTHRMVKSGAETADLSWSNGVSATSDQTSLTAYLRARF
jgi:hypothetical protein